MFVYYCQNCNKFEVFKSKTGDYKCPECGDDYLALKVEINEWNRYSNDQMLEVIRDALNPFEVKKPVVESMRINSTAGRSEKKAQRIVEELHIEDIEVKETKKQ